MAKVSTIEKDGFQVSASTAGAELQSLKHGGLEYLWQGDPEWWNQRAPVLFPIVGVLRNEFCTTPKGDAHLAIHGVAMRCEHELTAQAPDCLIYTLVANDETLAQYPYKFKLETIYRIIDGDTLEQRFRVTNDDDAPMPFSIGGHPGFNVPIDPDAPEVFEDYVFKFAQPWTFNSPSLTPEHLTDWEHPFPVIEDSDTKPLTHRTFDIDTITFEDVPESTITLLGTKSGHGVTVDFPDFDYLGSWSAMNDGPYVCIEPWTGMSTATDEDDAFESKRGCITLAPGASWEGAFTIKLF